MSLIAAPVLAQGVAQPPRLDVSSHSWISNDDYPREALKKGEQGPVQVKFDVTEKGRIENCEVVKSSGSPSLDAATCPMVINGPRYLPARDAAGKKVRAAVSKTVNWSLPGLPRN